MFMYENFAWHPAAIPVAFFEGHFWTLAVEEHFYILLSMALFFLRRTRLACLIFVWIVLYVAESAADARGLIDQDNLRRTYWQLDYLVFAAILALLLRNAQIRQATIRYLRPWTAFALTLAGAALHRESVHLRHPLLDAFSVVGWLSEMRIVAQFFFALWVAATMLHPASWTTRILELAPLRWLGRLSYSLYLWHVLFFFRLDSSTRITNPVLLALSGRPAKYFAALAMAVFSYYLLEKPLMRVGHRLAPPATAGRPELLEQARAV